MKVKMPTFSTFSPSGCPGQILFSFWVPGTILFNFWVFEPLLFQLFSTSGRWVASLSLTLAFHRPWQAMNGLGRRWLAMAGHRRARPWPAMTVTMDVASLGHGPIMPDWPEEPELFGADQLDRMRACNESNDSISYCLGSFGYRPSPGKAMASHCHPCSALAGFGRPWLAMHGGPRPIKACQGRP